MGRASGRLKAARERHTLVGEVSLDEEQAMNRAPTAAGPTLRHAAGTAPLLQPIR